MKNLFILLAFSVFTFAAMAQTETGPKKTATEATKAQQEVKKKPNQYVKMKDGKIWLYKDGQQSELTKEVVLGETTVSPNGEVVTKDGKQAKLKEGNIVNANGQLIDFAELKKKAMEQQQMQNKGE